MLGFAALSPTYLIFDTSPVRAEAGVQKSVCHR